MDNEKKITQFIVDNFLFGQNDQTLNRNTPLLEQGILDSTGVLELIAFVEEEFEVQIQDDEIMPENLNTIENIINFINSKKQIAFA